MFQPEKSTKKIINIDNLLMMEKKYKSNNKIIINYIDFFKMHFILINKIALRCVVYF